MKYEINRETSPIYNELVDSLNDKQIQLLNAYLDKVERFIPKGMIVADNADSLQIMNGGDDEEDEDLIEQLIHLANLSNDPIVSAMKLLEDQSYAKISSRRDEIIRRMKNGH